MKTNQKNIWTNMSSDQKLNVVGSVLLIISLFVSWYSDKDVFRSGETYSGLNGPLYLLGFSMLILGAGNLLITLGQAMKLPLIKTIKASTMGKLQMGAGFAAMYLLILINSVYFHPQFGLNILSKKSEAGVLIALVAAVLICVGGYLDFRKRLEENTTVDLKEAVVEKAQIVEQVERNVPTEPKALAQNVEDSVAQAIPEIQPAKVHRPIYSERDTRGKTEFERAKLYENLKKSMIRDTLSPNERKKLRAKETQESVFSAKLADKISPNDKVAAEKKAASSEKATEKKAQAWRMDL
ncbi:hypothetical protein IT411_01935 [Candidatus Peregrinibacteria bacterium]|nr:hypothetical protein [Candidatus Peregrinibacteria bacterium]